MNRNRLGLGTLLMAILGTVLSGCPRHEGSGTQGISAGSATADRQALEAFRAKGIEVPETQMTVQTKGAEAFDRERIREAIAEAKELPQDAQAQVRSEGGGGRDEDRMRASPTMAASPPEAEAARPAPAVDAMPRPEPPREISARQKTAKAPPGAGPAGDASADFAMALGKKDKAEAGESEGQEGGEKPHKTVLKQIAAAPREAKILVRNEEGKLVPMATREMRLVTYLEGPRARTVVDIVFENRTGRRLEGTFYFPLPADSSPVGFAMFSASIPIDAARSFEGGRALPKLPEDTSGLDRMEAFAPDRPPTGPGPDWQARQVARVVEQKRAREVYEEVVRHQIDPALLEWSGGNTFQARVFPIEAGALKRVVLVYEQTLPFDGEFLRYTFPLPEQKLPVPLSARVHLDDGLGAAKAVSMGKDNLAVVPKGKAVGPWTTFDLVQEDLGGALSVAVKPVDPKAQVLIGADPGGLPGRTFFARLLPSVPEGRLDKTGRALFVVDSSLSGEDGKAYELQAKTLEALLSGDDSIAEYAVLLFDVRPRWLHAPSWRKNSSGNRQATLAELRKVYLEGATNFDAVLSDLDANLSWLKQGGGATAFLLSDGQITWGQNQAVALVKHHPAAQAFRWICYRFGESAVNQALFDELTRNTAGRTVTVLSEAEIPAAASAHRKAAALLSDVRVADGSAADLAVAGQPKMLFPGQELQVAGRLTSDENARLVVTASLAGKELRFEAALPPKPNHLLAARAFGEVYTNRLLSLDDDRLDRMIVALSQHYLLANERSSLLILESDQAYEAFAIQAERVDLSNLEKLRAQEEDQRLDKLQGLDLDAASELARSVVRGLKAAGDKIVPPLRPQPLLDQPLAGGEERLQAELAYRDKRKADKLDVMVYDGVARVRALAGDTMGAVRALSCNVELRPQDTEAIRLVGYGLLALGQYQPAAELFERSRLLRPFEGQSYLEEGLALDGCGRLGDAAQRYEIVLSRSWPRHDYEVKTVAAFHYARLLRNLLLSKGLDPALQDGIQKRVEELAQVTGRDKIDFQFTTHWSTDNIDIDLWVIEPDGTKCYYGNKETPLGGKLWWDITDGLGPEIYHMRKAPPGEYIVATHYFGNNSPRLSVPTALLLVADRDVFGPEDRYTRRLQMRMLPKKDAVLELRRERFKTGIVTAPLEGK